MTAPVVSVVIPTRGRPQLLRRSVTSALSQTLRDIEVVVVVDGPDEDTSRVLNEWSDSRLRPVFLSTSLGGAEARNVGVRAATAPWIAFLDDDDEWLPEKLAVQLDCAERAQVRHPIISCFSKVLTPLGEYHWPTRVPSRDETIGDYLFVRRSLFQGEGFVGTPTLFTTRELLLAVPFAKGLKRHQDWDWLLRACARDDADLDFVRQRLVVLHMEERRPGISAGNDWRYSFEWGQRAREQLTPRAYAGFLLLVVSSIASRERAWRAFGQLLRESFVRGAPTSRMTGLFLGMWFVPERWRRKLRRYFSSARNK